MIARREPYVLFLDELNACTQEVQKAFYSLIHERRIGEYCLPEGSIVVGAGNRAQDSAIVKTMSSALINRMFHVQLKQMPDMGLNGLRQKVSILGSLDYINSKTGSSVFPRTTELTERTTFPLHAPGICSAMHSDRIWRWKKRTVHKPHPSKMLALSMSFLLYRIPVPVCFLAYDKKTLRNTHLLDEIIAHERRYGRANPEEQRRVIFPCTVFPAPNYLPELPKKQNQENFRKICCPLYIAPK